MSGGTTKATSQQTTSSSNAVDPRQLALLENNYATAQANAGELRPYTGPRTAGFNPAQIEAQGMLRDIARDGSGQAALGAARNAVQDMFGFAPGRITAGSITPRTVTGQSMTAATAAASPIAGARAVDSERIEAARIDPQAAIGTRDVTAGQLAGTDLSAYMNPYQQAVIDATISGNERARQIAAQATARKASAAGAFGGSRSAVLEAQTNEAYDRNNQAALADLNARNFTQAQSAATADIDRRLGADQFNAGNTLTAAQADAGLRQAAALANQQSQNDAARLNAGTALEAAKFNAGNDLNTQQYNAGQALQAALANQQAQNDAARLNATNAQGAALANQGADISAQQFNAEAMRASQQADIDNALAALGLKLNAAGQVTALNNAALSDAATRAGLLGGVGEVQQALEQGGLDAAYQEFLRQQGFGAQRQQMLNSSLGLIPVQQTVSGSSSGSGTEKQSGDLLGGILGTIMGGAKLGASFL